MPKMKKYISAADYFDHQDDKALKALGRIKSLIKEVVPDARETLIYNIPAYALVKNIKPSEHFMMAAYKYHVSIYPDSSTIEYFKDELQEYEAKKGTIQFLYKEPLPETLIKEMIAYRHKQLTDAAG